jgi:putative hydrolase of the HAD superfamily
VRTNELINGVRAVAFDAVGTLITPDPPVHLVYHAAGQRHGGRHSAEEIRNRFGTAFRGEEERDRNAFWRTDPAREAERWRRIVTAVLDDVTDQEACFRELWEHFARPTSWRCLPDVGPVLAELALRGLALGLASNFDSRLRAVTAGLRDLRPIGPVMVSADVGWRKPATEFFAEVVRAFDCEPNEVLLVGDDFENDYVGATTAGLRAVLLDTARSPGTDTVNRLSDLCR